MASLVPLLAPGLFNLPYQPVPPFESRVAAAADDAHVLPQRNRSPRARARYGVEAPCQDLSFQALELAQLA